MAALPLSGIANARAIVRQTGDCTDNCRWGGLESDYGLRASTEMLPLSPEALDSECGEADEHGHH